MEGEGSTGDVRGGWEGLFILLFLAVWAQRLLRGERLFCCRGQRLRTGVPVSYERGTPAGRVDGAGTKSSSQTSMTRFSRSCGGKR